VASLVTQLTALTQEIRELRRENLELRRQLDSARGVQQHQPYALAPLPTPCFSPVHPPGSRTRVVGDLSPAVGLAEAGYGDDVIMSSPQDDKDSKRPRRALAPELDAALGAPPGP
jgi:hypothetical protein